VIIEQALLTYLQAQGGLTTLVGASPNTRIYYSRAPQDVTESYIVFFKVSSPRSHSYSGSSHLAESRFQFSIFAETYKETKDIAAQLQTALDCKTGNIGTAPGVDMGAAFLDNETDLYESETGLYHCALDFRILHYD
jgi:hypothetical protein